MWRSNGPERCRNGLSVCVLASTLSLAGCSAIANHIATDLAKNQAKSFSTDLHIRGRAAAYLACLKGHGGTCGNNATNALPQTREALAGRPNSPTEPFAARSVEFDRENPRASMVQRKISYLYDTLTGVTPPDQSGQSLIKVSRRTDGVEELTVEFAAEDLEEYHKFIDEQTFGDQWRADAERAAKSAATRQDATLRQAACVMKFEQEYFRAYFRDGRFVQIQLNAQSLRNELKKRFPLLSGLPDSELDQTIKDLGASLSGSLFGNIGTLGFVTRGGLTFQFPVLTVGLDPTAKEAITLPKVDAVGTGADLIRVYLEAFFDAFNGLPAVSNATGCFKDGARDGCALPVFDPKAGAVTATQFGDVNTISNQAEAAASDTFGRLVRGGGPIALNNEALARLLETLVGVTVRKAVEKGAWCWYACPRDVSETLSVSPQEETVIKVTIRMAAPRVASTGR
jgi:hypothetical protein